MATFSASDIVGKTLIANEPVIIKRIPEDSASTVFNVKIGQPVGTVYSWISPGANNRSLYWMFKDENGRNYYSEHKVGRYSIKALQSQGVLTEAEKLEKEKEANQPLTTTITKQITKLALIAAGAYVLVNVLPGVLKK
jgi:penicillin V acylase-like amidase (Ntn superfamily)